MSFDAFPLDQTLKRAIGEMGFATPTAIQRDTIPAVLAGRDVLACAVTGSGKTAAFLLPILQRFIERPGPGTRALVLAPTRELAAQIDEHRRQLAAHARIDGAVVVGGVGMGPQEHAFRRGASVLVCTPGRLLDHMRLPYARLGAIEVLVLDEADRMLDMGFLPDIRRILAQLPARRQNVLLSATVPDEIATLARSMLRDPVVVDVGRPVAAAASISHAAYPVPQGRKSALLVDLLRAPGFRSVLVFTRTKHRADRLCRFLGTQGVVVDRIHGNRSQAQRTAALTRFRSGQVTVLVATDIAARGIDVEGVSHVVNFDVPGQPEDYVHRVGRTGRAAASGDALTLVSAEEEGDLKAIERALRATMERVTLPGFDYRAPAATAAAPLPAARRAAPGPRPSGAGHHWRGGGRPQTPRGSRAGGGVTARGGRPR
jgi:ATP-dependent RNA helicase RhlE